MVQDPPNTVGVEAHLALEYFSGVLGVDSLWWGTRPPLQEASEKSRFVEDELGSRSVLILVPVLSKSSERELMSKMLTAMNCPADWLKLEVQDAATLQKQLPKSPSSILVFGEQAYQILAELFSLSSFFESLGQFQSIPQSPSGAFGTVRVLVTYGPLELNERPSLKRETWNQMKLFFEDCL